MAIKSIQRTILAILLATTITSCTTLEKRKMKREFTIKVNAIVQNSIETREPCNITCGRLKDLISSYMGKF